MVFKNLIHAVNNKTINPRQVYINLISAVDKSDILTSEIFI